MAFPPGSESGLPVTKVVGWGRAGSFGRVPLKVILQTGRHPLSVPDGPFLPPPRHWLLPSPPPAHDHTHTPTVSLQTYAGSFLCGHQSVPFASISFLSVRPCNCSPPFFMLTLYLVLLSFVFLSLLFFLSFPVTASSSCQPPHLCLSPTEPCPLRCRLSPLSGSL